MADKFMAVPKHIAIIMDGNGRWAVNKGLPRTAGHVKGAEVFKKITEHCADIGVKYLTVYAFSTENWKRSAEEIEGIMGLLGKYLNNSLLQNEEGFRVRFIGRRDRISPELLKLMEQVEKDSEGNTDSLTLNIALDYGGRDEILHAARELAGLVKSGKLTEDNIDEQLFGAYLYSDCPDPDFILRPSGEQRLSNFLLWQSAYSELIYMDTLWPDFTSEMLDRAIEEFNSRNRRFGS